jgi:hypothetical protein
VPLFGSRRPDSGSGSEGIEIPPQPQGGFRGRLRVSGRAWLDAAGAVVPPIMASGFPLAKMVGDGRVADARAFLQFLKDEGVWFVRTLSAWNGTSIKANQFSPAYGLAWMEDLLQIAQEIGIYVMPVGVVDSDVFKIDWPAHLQTLGQYCYFYEMPMESGQEIPHSSQDQKASEWVKAYKPPSGVVYCEASVHGSSDTSTAFTGGSFICTHVLRDVPQVERHRTVAAVFRPFNKAFVSMEPDRNMDPKTWGDVARECVKQEMGLTYHAASVRDGQIPTGKDLEALRAMVAGMHG